MNPSDVRFEVVVPKDRVFVMGDHRSVSADSRCHLSDLSTSEPQVRGIHTGLDGRRASGCGSGTFNRATILHRPDTFDDIPAAKKAAPSEAVIKPEGVSC